MATFVTVNYSGVYVIRPRRPVSKDPAGNFVWREEIALRPIRLGKNEETGGVIGVVNTDHLPHNTVKACEAEWGKRWKEILEKEIQEGPCNLRLLEPGETIEVDGIDIQPGEKATAEDAARLKRLRPRRTTVLQGPITASTVTSDATSSEKTVRIGRKVAAKAPEAPINQITEDDAK